MSTTKKSTSSLLYLGPILGFIIFVFITHDIIITNILSTYYCSQEPNPKTHIVKKVEYPESIYWEDNVYPGFSKEDREVMIINYLDGVHLKTMALNAPNGKHIYIYNREVPKKEYLDISHQISLISKKIKKMHETQQDKQSKKYINDITRLYKDREAFQAKQTKLINSFPVNEKVYTKETLPKLNYTVTFNKIKLNTFASKFLYSDEAEIVDNRTKERISYNRRYMRFYYILQPDFAGGRYYWKNPMCGARISIEKKTFGYFRQFGSSKHKRNIHKELTHRYKNKEGI